MIKINIMNKKELFLGLFFFLMAILVHQNILYAKAILLLSVTFVFIPLLLIWELKKTSITLYERIFFAYYKILCYIASVFFVMGYQGKDWLAIASLLFLILFLLVVLFSKRKWKSILPLYFYFQVSTLLYFVFF